MRKIPREASEIREGKSEYPRDHPWVNFSRQPLRTFHYLSNFSRDTTNWSSSHPCDKFVSKCVPPAVAHAWAGACTASAALHGGAAPQEAVGRFGECKSEQILVYVWRNIMAPSPNFDSLQFRFLWVYTEVCNERRNRGCRSFELPKLNLLKNSN